MQKLGIGLIALASVFGGSAFGQVPDAVQPPLCTTELSYTIKDATGKVRDQTVYNRNWPINCFVAVEFKYLFLDKVFDAGKTEYEAISGRSIPTP